MGFSQRTKKYLKAAANTIGVQIADSKHIGVDFWHDFRRLDIRDGYFLDVGANVGQWATEARINFPKIPILSVEPEPENFAELCRQFHTDGQHRAVQLAASSQPGFAELRLGKYPTWHSLEPGFENQSTRCITIQTETIDRIAQQFDLGRVSLLKIDVEGHEIACIKGAEQMFCSGRIDTVLVEVGFKGGFHSLFADVESALADYGQFFVALYNVVSRPGLVRTDIANAFFSRQDICLPTT